MEEIDRLGWVDGLAISTYGLNIGVRVSDARVMADITSDLPPGWTATSEPVDRMYSLRVGGEGARPGLRSFHLAYADSVQLARTMALHEAIGALSSHLHLTVAEYAPGW